jgi:hypothetical protein
MISVLILGAVVILPVGVLALLDHTATRTELLAAAAVLLLPQAFLFLGANLVARRVRFYETKLVMQRGLWPFKRTDIDRYATITRVRASDSLGVTVDLDDGRRYKLADPFFTVVHGSLPDVELKAGEYAAPMLRMRKIARFIELAVQEQRDA